MKEFRKRKSFKQILYGPVAVLILLAAALFLIRGAFGVYESEQASRKELRSAQQQQSDLSARQQFLRDEISKLSSKQGMEEELRTKFPVVKEGEKMVIIVEPQDTDMSSSTTGSVSLWQRVVDFFR